MDTTLRFKVNGQQRQVTTDGDRTLLDLLREEFGLTGTKYGCGEGQCGACTVLIDGKRAFACRTRAQAVADKDVLTIEGLAGGEKLHPVQEAFLAEGAFQCGYCTPGMIMNAVALLKEKPRPSDAETVEWMNRNVCRCCSYTRILDAVKRAAEAGV